MSSYYRLKAREALSGKWGIGSLWLNPYMNATVAAFYREINAKVTVE